MSDPKDDWEELERVVNLTHKMFREVSGYAVEIGKIQLRLRTRARADRNAAVVVREGHVFGHGEENVLLFQREPSDEVE